jgi:poly-gamma-glutamate capsule biosynthesis protein CapA/YwtB (metallophosphatase superfamily)
VSFLGQTVQADGHGKANLVLGRPTALRIGAPGFLDEIAILGWESDRKKFPVRLLRGLDGRRVVLHFGGDVMFGRRYLSPTEGAPLLEAGNEAQGAKAVVSDLAEVFRAADIGVVNLETVAGYLADSLAYPGKRFLLQSPPGALEALPFMGVHVVSLANNHVRDWLEPGLEDTLQAVDAAGLMRVGAGLTEEEATAPLVVEVGALRIGFLAFTSVNGSFVNNSYPDTDVVPPTDLSPKEAWLYENRLWGIELPDWTVPEALRRIGEAWRIFSSQEGNLTAQSIASAWSSLEEVYPELQDWVARRGHGGAAAFQTRASTQAISDLAAQSDIVVVQLHAGYQFSDVASSTLRRYARAAIEAGADIVIAHHPHVLQGFEWHQGKLIVHSLGNFIFDQDFLSTFDAGFVRAVFEDGALLEARFVPTSLVGYRPVPVVDLAARRCFSRLLEFSNPNSTADRDPVTSAVRPFLEEQAEVQWPGLTIEWGTARMLQASTTLQSVIRIEGPSATKLGDNMLWPARLGQEANSDAEILIGRDILGWGSFETLLASDGADESAHWILDHNDEQIGKETAPRRRGYLRLLRNDRNKSNLVTRPVARMPLPKHRFYRRTDGQPAQPLDPEPTYSVILLARAQGDALPSLRLDFYHFDDANPSEDPQSTSLGRWEIPIQGLTDEWTQVEIDVQLPSKGSIPVNMAMLYLALAPPSSGEAVLEVDDISFIEWRSAAAMPEVWGAYTHARSAQSISVQVEAIPLGP